MLCIVRSLTVFCPNTLQMFRTICVALVPNLNSYNRQVRITFEVA